MHTDPTPSREHGMVLPISLVLLGLLASTAILAMQSVALELAMAGNEWYRLRAATAAETGLLRMCDALHLAPPGTVPADLPLQTLGDSGDSFQATIRPLGSDPSITDESAGLLQGERFRIDAHGRSVRGAVSDIQVGLVLIRDTAGNVVELRRRYWKRAPD